MDDSTFGFKPGDIDIINRVISSLESISKAAIFGSRAKGNYQKGSDVDIAVWSANGHDAVQLNSLLNEETPLPYKFDVLAYNSINNQDLTEHIDSRGIIIFQK